MNNLSLLLYTNEKYIPIAYLSSIQHKKFLNLNITKYLVTNKFIDQNFNFTNFNIIDTQVTFTDDASHFRNVMYEALTNYIKTDYILYFQDDYYLINYIKIDNFIKLFNFMQNNNIGFLSLYGHDKINGEYIYNDLSKLIKFNYNYEYCFSTQPCIWNRRFLLEILESNPYLTMRMLDTAKFKNKQGKHISENWDYNWSGAGLIFDSPEMGNYALDTHNGLDDYYLLIYSEIIRHGKFNTHTHKNNKFIVNQIISEYNLLKDLRYNEFL